MLSSVIGIEILCTGLYAYDKYMRMKNIVLKNCVKVCYSNKIPFAIKFERINEF